MITALIAAFCLLSQNPPSLTQVWKSFSEEGFSGGAIVVSGSKVLLFEIHNDSKTRSLQISKTSGFPICSVTKAFTAEIVLDLIDEGKLSLDGTVRQYLPWMPEFTSQITVRQLLTHTSGLPNMDGVLGVDADGVGSIYRSFSESLKSLRTRLLKLVGDHPANQPGTKYDYNNTDFLVLQGITEEITHRPYEALLNDRILRKAKMKRTHVARWERTQDAFVDCFQSSAKGDVPLPPFNMAVYGGAAGLISTPIELSQWLKFTLSDPVGKRLITTGSQFGGFQGFGGYAYQTDAVIKAVALAKAPNQNTKEVAFERPGAVNGYGLQLSFLPERNLAVAVFSNREGQKLGSIFEGKGLAFDLLVAACREISSK
jgi:CubicO group peptidase (beta-lactamase class C family)